MLQFTVSQKKKLPGEILPPPKKKKVTSPKYGIIDYTIDIL